MQNTQYETNTSMRQAAAKGVIWSAAQIYGDRVISFVVLLILARLLSPTAFGLVALATVFISFAQILIDQGFGDAIVHASEIHQALLNTAFWTNLITSIVITFVGMSLSQVIADFYHESQLTVIIRWLSLGLVISSLSSVQQALLKRRLDFRGLAIRSLVATLGSGLVAASMAVLGGGVWSLVAKMLLYGFIGVIVLWGISEWRPSFSYSVESFRRLYSYGINIVGANFVDFFSRRSDDFLIGLFLGSTMLGYYSLAYTFLLTVTEILIVVPNAVVFPIFSRLQHDMPLMRKSFYDATQMISIITIPFFTCIIILAPEIVHALYGPQWVMSIPVVQVLMLIGVVHSAFYFFGNLLKAVGKPGWRFAILSITAFLNVIGFAVTVRWGIVAVAISYVCVGYLIAPFYFYLVSRAIGLSIKIYAEQYIPAIMTTTLMAVVIFATRAALGSLPGSNLRLAVLIVFGASGYLVSLFLVARPLFYRILNWAATTLPQAGPYLSLILRYEHK